MVTIYDYTDYRKYLRDLYLYTKSEKPDFTYKNIAESAGFRSKGYLTQIFQGKTNISDRVLNELIKIFKLKKREVKYLRTMVRFDGAKHNSEKQSHFQRLVKLRSSKITYLKPSSFEVFGKWYYTAVRELLNFYRFNGDYQELAGKLVPAITPAEARSTIDILEKHQLIQKNDDGSYSLTNKVVSTGIDENPFAFSNFLMETIDLAKGALENLPKDKRSISTLTASVSEELYEIIVQKIHAFRRELMETIRANKNTDRVCQINFQCFQLSNGEAEEETNGGHEKPSKI